MPLAPMPLRDYLAHSADLLRRAADAIPQPAVDAAVDALAAESFNLAPEGRNPPVSNSSPARVQPLMPTL
jgi:hypothetical protein